MNLCWLNFQCIYISIFVAFILFYYLLSLFSSIEELFVNCSRTNLVIGELLVKMAGCHQELWVHLISHINRWIMQTMQIVKTLLVNNLLVRYLVGGHFSPIFTSTPAFLRLTSIYFETMRSMEFNGKSSVKTLDMVYLFYVHTNGINIVITAPQRTAWDTGHETQSAKCTSLTVAAQGGRCAPRRPPQRGRTEPRSGLLQAWDDGRPIWSPPRWGRGPRNPHWGPSASTSITTAKSKNHTKKRGKVKTN